MAIENDFICESVRGVLLAGGTGSRLAPLTNVTNKHLLPVGNMPMIEWPLRSMIDAGVKNIMVITGREHAGAIFEYLGTGHKWGVELTYRVQEAPKGIAHALALAEDFCRSTYTLLMLGDNIFLGSLRHFVQHRVHDRAKILLKEVDDPERFGVVEIKDRRVIKITEKPEKPKSNLIQTGCYLYGCDVFDRIRTLKPSARGELEITDLNMSYVKSKTLMYDVFKDPWTDAGTMETYWHANEWATDGWF